MVNAAALVGTGQLPKFEQDLFAMRGEQPFYLIPDGGSAGHQSGSRADPQRRSLCR